MHAWSAALVALAGCGTSDPSPVADGTTLAGRAQALAAGYEQTFTLPAEPWPGVGSATDQRILLAAREAELLAQVAREPAPDPDDLLELGVLYTRVQEHRRGMAWTLRALERAPDGPGVWFWLGANRLQDDAVEEALVLLRYSAELDPRAPETQRFLGEAWKLAGDEEAALAALDRALALAPDYIEALWERGALLEARGETAEARRTLEHLLALDPDHPSGLYLMIRLLEERSEPGDAERAASLRERHARATLLDDLGLRGIGLPRAIQKVQLGIHYIQLRQPARAEREFREAIPELEDPAALGNALAGLVDALLRQERLGEIEEPLSRLEELDPSHPGLPTLIEQARLRGLR